MKKKSRFRKWLIHKLGGLCEDDIVKPQALTMEKKIQRVRAEFRIQAYEEIPQERIKRVLLSSIFDELEKYYFEIKKFDLDTICIYSMELEFVLQ